MKHLLAVTLLAACFMLASCLAYSSILKMEATCSSETSVDFQRLTGVISQKTELFKITTANASNPTVLQKFSLAPLSCSAPKKFTQFKSLLLLSSDQRTTQVVFYYLKLALKLGYSAFSIANTIYYLPLRVFLTIVILLFMT
jgi:hypothetical protein